MALLLGPKGPTVAAEGCRPPQELEKAARRAAIFLVIDKDQNKIVTKKTIDCDGNFDLFWYEIITIDIDWLESP